MSTPQPQPKTSEILQGIAVMAIICFSLAIYFGLSDDSCSEVDGLKKQIAEKDTTIKEQEFRLEQFGTTTWSQSRQLLKSREMYLNSETNKLKPANRKQVYPLIESKYDLLMDCIGSGGCNDQLATEE